MEKMIVRFRKLDKASKEEIVKRFVQMQNGLITSEEFLHFSAGIKNKQEKIKLFILKTAL